VFRITVREEGKEDWTEDYPNVGKHWEVENQPEAEIVGKSFVDKFNKTLRPGEKPREFIKAEYLGEDLAYDSREPE
jgi:hypothetical protein